MSLRVAGIASTVVALCCFVVLVFAALASLLFMAQTSQELSILGVAFYVQSASGHAWVMAVSVIAMFAGLLGVAASTVAMIAAQ